MLKTIFTKRNIIIFAICSLFTTLCQTIVLLNIKVEIGTFTFWQVIIVTNIIGFVFGYFVKKNYDLFFHK